MRSQRPVEERLREVADWRASGETAAAFAARRGYAKSTLLTWSAAATTPTPRTDAEPPPRTDIESEETRFARLEVAAPVRASLVVEVGAARVVVERGFDAELLRRIVRALSAPVGT